MPPPLPYPARSGRLWRDNQDESGASIKMRQGGRFRGSLTLAVALASLD
jgi:hypothetical protein